MENWELLFKKKFIESLVGADPSHDLMHVERVVKTAKQLCREESARIEVVLPAAWLHDCVLLPKNHPERSKASRLAAEEALRFLKVIEYPQMYLADVAHAIESHSFSAGIKPQTIEAKIVQDADRLDALGAIGVARCFVTAGVLQRPLYEASDPFCAHRLADDSVYTLDHFYKKLLTLSTTLNTDSAKKIGQQRTQFLLDYLEQLKLEII